MELETINKLYLELSQITTATTAREILLQKQLAEARRDAERYSWLRMNRLWLKVNLPTIAAPDFDAAIDNAINAAEGPA